VRVRAPHLEAGGHAVVVEHRVASHHDVVPLWPRAHVPQDALALLPGPYQGGAAHGAGEAARLGHPVGHQGRRRHDEVRALGAQVQPGDLRGRLAEPRHPRPLAPRARRLQRGRVSCRQLLHAPRVPEPLVQPGQRPQRLRRLAQPHLVRQDAAAEPRLPLLPDPRHARQLVRPQRQRPARQPRGEHQRVAAALRLLRPVDLGDGGDELRGACARLVSQGPHRRLPLRLGSRVIVCAVILGRVVVKPVVGPGVRVRRPRLRTLRRCGCLCLHLSGHIATQPLRL